MKKFLILLLIGLSVLSVTKVPAQTLNWSKGYLDSPEDIIYEYNWPYLSCDKKYFYVSSPQSYMRNIGIYDVKSGNLIKKFIRQSKLNHYMINDSVIVRFSYPVADSTNSCHIIYDNIDEYIENYKHIFDERLLYNGKQINIYQNEYRDFINDDLLIFIGKYDNTFSFIFWDIKSKCVSNVIETKEFDLWGNIRSIAFDKKNNILYFSDDFSLYKYDIFSKIILLTKPLLKVSALSLSSNSKYLALTYFEPENSEFQFSILNSDDLDVLNEQPTKEVFKTSPSAISPNSNLFAYQSDNDSLKIFNLTDKTYLTCSTLFPPDYIHFINNDQIIFSSENYGFTAIYDIKEKKQVKTLIVNESKIMDIKYSHNGKFIAVLGRKFIKVLDAETGNLINLFNVEIDDNLETELYDMDFSKNDDKIVFSRNFKGYIICDLSNNSVNFFNTNSKVISACYSTDNNDIIAYGNDQSEVIVANDNGSVIIKNMNETGYGVRAVMFAEHNNLLYYVVYNPSDFKNYTYCWDYKDNELTKITGFMFIFQSIEYILDTYHNRYICSETFNYDTKNQTNSLIKNDNVPSDYASTLYNISKDGLYSVFGQWNINYEYDQMFCNLCKNDNHLGETLIKSLLIPNFLPINSRVAGGSGTGIPNYPVISPDNKTLILGLDCGSIISLNIENLTPVEDDVKLSDGFRIVNVENKDTYLNCEISSTNEFDSFDYYIYDLSGKLLNQGALGAIGQGSNTITINYTKKMLYPAILLVKSRVNNTYQSKLFY